MSDYKTHPLYRKHTLDSLMENLWGFYKAHFAPLFIISFVFSVAVTWFTLSLDTGAIMEMAAEEDMEALMEFFRSYIKMMIPVVIISIYGAVFLSLYVYRCAQGSVNYAGLIGQSFRYMLTASIIIVLFIPFATISLIAGLIVLIIGIFFALIWLGALYSFILPLLINEGNDITNAIVRSFRLLHRHFWPNIGWTAVVFVMLMIISMVISGLSLIPFAGSFLKTMANPEEAGHLLEMVRSPVYLIFSAALNALLMPVFPIFSYILYFNAKAREDEPAGEV
ncbi:MAG: hypothetical protein FJY11_06775 [Bacteroidetes bacterium]|nr:hypothetical protein [Bacteroidota bacterium]